MADRKTKPLPTSPPRASTWPFISSVYWPKAGNTANPSESHVDLEQEEVPRNGLTTSAPGRTGPLLPQRTRHQ